MNTLMPKETYRQISDISLNYLINDIKIKGLIFDFDGTIIRNKKISIGTLNFIKEAKVKGLRVSVLSNNLYLNNTILKNMDIDITKKFACKPLKRPFLEMAKIMNLLPSSIAVIGNNRISDIFGANRAGMYSIYIQNINGFLFKKKIRNNLKNIGIKHIN